MVEREKFFLNILIPRQRKCRDAMRGWYAVTVYGEGGAAFLLFILALHIGMAELCRSAESDVCPMPLADDATELANFYTSVGWFSPAFLNALASLMIAFYANTCLGLYRDTYSACQSLRNSVQDLSALACGTIHPENRQARLEFWRCANLFHAVSYVLADRQRSAYSFEGFLVPVAEAFGEHDGRDKMGMLRRVELEAFEQVTDV